MFDSCYWAAAQSGLESFHRSPPQEEPPKRLKRRWKYYPCGLGWKYDRYYMSLFVYMWIYVCISIYIYINTHIHIYATGLFADFFLHHSGCHLWQMFHIKFILWVCERFSSCAGSAYISLYSHITLVESRNTFNYWVNLLFDKSFSLQTLFNVRCRQSN